jgi:MFS family permease
VPNQGRQPGAPDSQPGGQPASAPPADLAPRRGSFWRDLKVVWAEQDFRRLLSTRLISQTGDGVFTAGLGTYVFFNAATFPSPAKGAAAFAVLYAPYSLIGPFAGVFIDRWSRRQILVYSALLRTVFVTLTAAVMVAGNQGAPLYVAVLLTLGVNRFFLSSLSAALPHTVPPDKLVMANSVSPTAGGIMSFVGGLVGLGVNVGTGDTERGAAITLLVAGGCYVCSSLVARTMPRDLLGPVRDSSQPPPGRLLTELGVVLQGLAAGARYIARRREPAAALGATGGNRLFYGVLFLMSILLYRNYFYHSTVTTAEGHYGTLVAVVAIGYGAAALVTPQVTRRLTKPAFMAVMLAVSAILVGGLGSTFDQVAYLVMGFFLGLAGQCIAICSATILQEQLADDYRGRAFSFYDMTFNITFVVGALVGAQFMPSTGKSPALVAVVAVGFAVVTVAFWLAVRHSAGPGSWPAGSSGSGGGTASPADAAQASSS